MKKYIRLFLFMMVAWLCVQCSSGGDTAGTPTYDEHISAYSGGSLSRQGEVRVLFSSDIPQEVLDKYQPDDLMQISPKVEGKFVMADARTLTFHPTNEMERNTQYTAKVRTDRIFEAKEPFSFQFNTLPFALSANVKTLTEGEGGYQILVSINTADNEKPDVVEKHIQFSHKCTTNWTHSDQGTSHQVMLDIKPDKDINLLIQSVADASLGLEEKLLTEVSLPSFHSFKVIKAISKTDDRHYIEVTFNKALDTKQDHKGLIYIDGTPTELVVEGNVVRAYANMQAGKQVTLVVDKSLRSHNQVVLGEPYRQEITIQTNKPEVEFVSDGTIIPQSDQILVPFRSIYMRGVRVLVYKVFANMMGTMMQQGNLDSYEGLCYAARPVAATTFYIDQPDIDLTTWHTYAIDLSKQFQVEPGAMYRIELSLDARLSVWPSDSLPALSRQELAQEDARLLESQSRTFDYTTYYYTGMGHDQQQWWVDNYYQKRKDPSTPYYYDDRIVARNVLATNIGLTAQRGTDQDISIVAVNLPDALPLADTDIKAYNHQQQLVATARTNADGIAQLHYDVKAGQPSYIVATLGNDVSYLKIPDNESLSTSTFDVSGQSIQRGLKGYIYGERGVWRPGDTLHIGFMLNDRKHSLPEGHPVTLRLTNPLGQLVHTQTLTSGIMGTYAFNVATDADAPTGVWNAQINVGGVNFEKSLRIEAIKPNRLKINLTLPDGALTKGDNHSQLYTEWLNGQKAGGLKYDISATIVQSKTSWPKLKEYTFDDPTKSFETAEQEISKGTVSESGKAATNIQFNIDKDNAPGMLRCNLVTHVYEPSGEFSTDVTQAQIAPYRRFVGIKAPQQTKQTQLDTDKKHTYSVISVDKDGHPQANVRIDVQIYKVNWYWWWSSTRDDLAGYTKSEHHTPFRDLSVTTDSEGKATFDMNIAKQEWGTYLIVAQDQECHHSTGVLSYFDWPWMTSRRSTENGESATQLTLSTDRKEYAPGDKIHLSVPSEAGSRAIVSICNGSQILSLRTYPCQKGQTEILLDVTEQMMPNVYLAVSLVQPYNQTINDMPIRMYGITPVTVTSAASHLQPVVKCDDEFRSESTCQVTVSEQSGRPMGYTLAIVDEGLLDLTHFKTPDAWSLFNAREALGVRFWDMYQLVSGAYGGRIEQFFSIGGDEALNNAPKAIVNRFTPMVHFAGPFELKKGEKRTHSVNVPNYNGRVRVMVVAGDGQAYGHTDKSVLVRRPLMLIGTMPRQIGVNDEMTVAATVFATKALGKVRVQLSAADGLQVVGDKVQTLQFDAAGDQTVQFRIRAGEYAGMSTVSLQASAGSDRADYTAQIDMRAVSIPISQTTEVKIAPGQTYQTDITLPGNSDNKLLTELSAIQPLNMTYRINQLLVYPHGCAEQTVSKAFPQLYLAEFADLSLTQAAKVEENVKYCIRRIGSYQTPDGGIAYWPSSRNSNVWVSGYVLHFLTEAAARGYFVQTDMMNRLKSYVTKQANSWEPKYNGEENAYLLYVLANAQSSQLGAMNRMLEHAAELSRTCNDLLAGAYALSGRKDISQKLLQSGSGTSHNHWYNPEAAHLMALDLVSDAKALECAETLRSRLMSDQWLSTSNCAMSLIALSHYYKHTKQSSGLNFQAKVNGKLIGDIDSKKFTWTAQTEMEQPKAKLEVTNRDKNGTLYLNLTAQGMASQSSVPASSNGLELTIHYKDQNGGSISPASLQQSTTFHAVLTVSNKTMNAVDNVAVTHIVPAGWEILSSKPSNSVSYQDQRDDRLLSYIDRLAQGASVTIDVTLSATYAGKYYLPAIHAEAMYDNQISGNTASSECVVQ